MIKTFSSLCAMLSITLVMYSQQKGKMILESVPAPSIEKNIVGEPTSQPIAVYLPPTYDKETSKRYPVVYFLPGYEDTIAAYTKGYINSYYFESSMNSVVTQGRIKEMIVVIINGFNLFEGCFYNNSPVTGNWEDFVTKDVVTYIDNKYRTIKSSDSRAITGLSMGGYGALHLSMRHPSLFSVAVGEVSGLAAPGGLVKTSLFSDKNISKRVISIINQLKSLDRQQAHKKYIDTINYYRKIKDWVTLFSFAYGSAFDPDTNINAPYFNYPYTLDQSNNLVVDSSIYKRWDKGFGDLYSKVTLYKDSLTKLKGYGLDYGTSDYFQWIVEGNIYYDKILTEANITHDLWVNNGGHGDKHKSRYEQIALPFCDSLLTYDTSNLNNAAEIDAAVFSGQVSTPIIDSLGKTITVKIKSTEKINAIKPSIFASPGAKIVPSTGSAIDLSSGTAQIKIISENGKVSANWTVVASVEQTGVRSLSQNKLVINSVSSSNQILISADDKIISKVEVIDITGKFVFSKITNSQYVSIENNNIGNGLFFVKAYIGNEVMTGKVVIM